MKKSVLFYLFLILSLPLFESCLFLFAHDCEEEHYLKYDLKVPDWMEEVMESDELEIDERMSVIFSIPEVSRYNYEIGMKCKFELNSTFLSFKIKPLSDDKTSHTEYLSCGWVKNEKERITIEEIDGIFTFDCNKNAIKQKPANESKEASYWGYNTKNAKFEKCEDGYNMYLITQEDDSLGPFHFTKPM